MDPELFDRLHIDCEAPWRCMECDRPVCPRCDPSPKEPCFCAECVAFGVGGAV